MRSRILLKVFATPRKSENFVNRQLLEKEIIRKEITPVSDYTGMKYVVFLEYKSS